MFRHKLGTWTKWCSTGQAATSLLLLPRGQEAQARSLRL